MKEHGPTKLIGDILATTILVLRNFGYLFIKPYKAMRHIAEHSHWGEVYIIFSLCYLYFAMAAAIRNQTIRPLIITSSAMVSFGFFIVTFIFVVYFFKFFSQQLSLKSKELSLATTFAYSLLPTLLWFYITSSLFLLLPPPRGEGPFGISLSFAFVVFSLALLAWRLILLYLSLRFATKASFGQIIFMILIFTACFLPYSYLMYFLGIFRVPFI